MENKYQIDCVLLVDDDPVTNFLNEQVLQEMQLCKNIEVTDSVEQALQFITNCYMPEENPNCLLVFMDLNMPGLDGFDFLDELNSRTEIPVHKIDVIILSSSFHRIDIERAENYKILEYMVKPLTAEKVKLALNKKIKNRAT